MDNHSLRLYQNKLSIQKFDYASLEIYAHAGNFFQQVILM